MVDGREGRTSQMPVKVRATLEKVGEPQAQKVPPAEARREPQGWGMPPGPLQVCRGTLAVTVTKSQLHGHS